MYTKNVVQLTIYACILALLWNEVYGAPRLPPESTVPNKKLPNVNRNLTTQNPRDNEDAIPNETSVDDVKIIKIPRPSWLENFVIGLREGLLYILVKAPTREGRNPYG
ncbi:hypothetical protein QAD02_006588 [Eretmocerus hayati]|uniref:Uncharacterized protein n=1 Tax=Eretmocerus hayati TaxID=131215 RepID=A0ACC2N1P0_9HYME|nr:hypothetical protein QAD02_006588 [Eretmocerus hayati]